MTTVLQSQSQGPAPDEIGDLRFTMIARDNGPSARVIATLKRISPVFFGDSPLRTEIAATIDTDRYPVSSGWQTFIADQSSSCCWIRNPQTGTKTGMQFFDAVWFVEVQLMKNDSTGDPAVLSVSVVRDRR